MAVIGLGGVVIDRGADGILFWGIHADGFQGIAQPALVRRIPEVLPRPEQFPRDAERAAERAAIHVPRLIVQEVPRSPLPLHRAIVPVKRVLLARLGRGQKSWPITRLLRDALAMKLVKHARIGHAA